MEQALYEARLQQTFLTLYTIQPIRLHSNFRIVVLDNTLMLRLCYKSTWANRLYVGHLHIADVMRVEKMPP
jgi:hypothetical protein